MNATTRINDQGQEVSEVSGQPGRVTTGRPSTPPEIAEFDVFATIPNAYGDDWDQEGSR